MKLLVLCPGDIPKSVSGIRCFTQVLNYYIPNNLKDIADVEVVNLPLSDNNAVLSIFESLKPNYDAVLALGLRYFSRIPKHFISVLRSKVKCPIVQMHDGSRLDLDGVDLTLTFKEVDGISPSKLEAHRKYNKCVGWAADESVFKCSSENTRELNVLIDHTNYGGGPDYSLEILRDVFSFVDSGSWKDKFDSVSINRLSSGFVEHLDKLPLELDQYDRTKIIPVTELSKHYQKADIFIVTHPESLGLVVLETAMCGALVVCKNGFVSNDRLNTINHHSYTSTIDWNIVLNCLNKEANREKAIANNWKVMARNIINEISILTESHEHNSN